MRVERFYERQLLLLEQVAAGEALGPVLESIVRLIEQESGGMLCSILLLDGEAGVLRHGAAPTLPVDYVRVLDGSRIGPEEGSCGRAAYLAERVIVEDVTTHPYWVKYHELATVHGLRACWSSPIVSRQSQVLGTFAMYYRDARGPTEDEMSWVGAATHLAAVAISHDRAQRAVEASECRARQLARLYAVSSSVHEAIVRVRDIDELYAQACRIAVEQGLARLAWVGLRGEDEDRLRPVARFGVDDGYLEHVTLSLTDPRMNRGPAGRAMASGRSALTPDIASDADFYWKEAALARGLKCCAVFPLTQRGRTIGVFALYAGSVGAFQTEELSVLDALAASISFAVESAHAEAERKRLFWELRSSEQRLSAVFEHTPNVSIQWYDEQARLLHCNKVSERLFGRSAAEAKGKRLDELNFEPEAAARFRSALDQVARSGKAAGPAEFEFRKPDGTPGLLLSTIFELPVSDGGRCFACMDVDLTEYRRMEQSVRSEERLRELVYRSVPDVLFCIAVEPGDNFRFLSVNPAFLAATGLDEGQVIGKLLEDVLSPPSLPRTRAKYAEAMLSRQVVSWEELSSAGDGLRYGEVTITPVFDESGTCTNLVGTVRDISPRKRAEEERRGLERQVHQAERLQALGTLTGGIAHDLNNLLSAIYGNVDLGLMELGPEHPAYECLMEISKAARRATDMVRQILSFSRQDAPLRKALDVRDVIEEAVRLLRVTLPGSAQIELRLAADTPRILGNDSQIHQVLMNLGTNAALALGGRTGRVRVTSEPVLLDPREPGSPPGLPGGAYARLSVSDDGCGMDEATLRRVFEPFFTTRPHGQGTGLGLSVVHGIMQHHEGAITVASTPNHGTTFQLYFPSLEEPATPAMTEGAGRRLAGERNHVLYVDDEEALVSLASRALPQAGYRVTGHSDPVQALADFQSRSAEFDAVVTDCSMPGLSGPDLVREIWRLRPDLPIVMTSGHIQAHELELATQLGLGAVVVKPHALDELAHAVQARRSQPLTGTSPSQD